MMAQKTSAKGFGPGQDSVVILGPQDSRQNNEQKKVRITES